MTLSWAPWNPLAGLSEEGREGFVRGLLEGLVECGSDPSDPRFDALSLTAESLFKTSGPKAVRALVERAYPTTYPSYAEKDSCETLAGYLYSILCSIAGLPAPHMPGGAVGPVSGAKLAEAVGEPDWKYDPDLMPPRLEGTPWVYDSADDLALRKALALETMGDYGPSGYPFQAMMDACGSLATRDLSLCDGNGNEILAIRSGTVPTFRST